MSSNSIDTLQTPPRRFGGALSAGLALVLGSSFPGCGDDMAGDTAEAVFTETDTTGVSGENSTSGSTDAATSTTDTGEIPTETGSDTENTSTCEATSCGEFLERNKDLNGVLSCEDPVAPLTPTVLRNMIVDIFLEKYDGCFGEGADHLISIPKADQFDFLSGQISIPPPHFSVAMNWLNNLQPNVPFQACIDSVDERIDGIATAFVDFHNSDPVLVASDGEITALDPDVHAQNFGVVNVCMLPESEPVWGVYAQVGGNCVDGLGLSPLRFLQLYDNEVAVSGVVLLKPGAEDSAAESALINMSASFDKSGSLTLEALLDPVQAHPNFCARVSLLNEDMEPIAGTSPGSPWQIQACISDSGKCPEPYVVPDSYPLDQPKLVIGYEG